MSAVEIIVVALLRGSGDISDFVSDAMLVNVTRFRLGLVHDGITRSGKFLSNFHTLMTSAMYMGRKSKSDSCGIQSWSGRCDVIE